MKQIIHNLKSCEQELSQEYETLSSQNRDLENLSIAMQKIVKAIDCLDRCENQVNYSQRR